MVQCNYCSQRSAVLKRPKTGEKICKECFFVQFELEVHQTIVGNSLFKRGERVAIAASGGKDSTVLAHVLTKLNRQHDYGLNLFLLSIDEGITGYRDDSLESVKRNQSDYAVPLLIVGYKELYGWSMDEIVAAIGLKNSLVLHCATMRCAFSTQRHSTQLTHTRSTLCSALALLLYFSRLHFLRRVPSSSPRSRCRVAQSRQDLHRSQRRRHG